MEKILGTTIVLLGAAALSATVATVQIDLSGYDSGSDVNSSFQAYRGDPSAMANHLNEWLANSSGWCGSKANTSSETSSYFKSAVGSEDGSVTVTYTNRRGYGGSGVGLKVSLDAAGYSADALFFSDIHSGFGYLHRRHLSGLSGLPDGKWLAGGRVAGDVRHDYCDGRSFRKQTDF